MVRRAASRCFFALLLLPLACGGEERAGALVLDSAGVSIVQSRSPTWAAGDAWRVVEPFLLEVGGETSRDPAGLFRVAGGLLLRDGRVVVANAGTSQLKLYGYDGDLLATVGREGSGPGEFRWIGGLYALGADSILVYDGGLERLTVLGPDLDVARTFHFDPAVDPFVIPAGVLADGSVLATRVSPMTGLVREGVNVDTAEVLRFDRRGGLLDTLARVPHNWRYLARQGAVRTVLGIPFAPRGRLSVQPKGFCYGTGEAYRIDCYHESGTLERIIRLEEARRPVTDSMIQAHFEREWTQASENRRRALNRLRADLPIPERLPAFRALLADETGSLWVADSEGDDWRVFDRTGVLLGPIALPPGARPLQIGRNFLLALHTDELGVERVRLYRLRRDKGT